jgi:hypothetical protein
MRNPRAALIPAAMLAACAGLADSALAQSWTETGDAGDLPASAQLATGSGGLFSISGSINGASDIDMYQVEICDFANFSATTVGGTTLDTQLFIFSAAGLGVVSNDDDPGGAGLQSTIPVGHIPSGGAYYIAVSLYNRDPISSGGLIFQPAAFTEVTPANGPGASSAVSGWQGATTATGAYTITLNGACHVDPNATGACCRADGTCAVMTLAACLAESGTFGGANSACGSITCAPAGACCLNNGTCIQRTLAACNAAAGVWAGAGVACGGCVPISYLPLPLTYNWNGMVSAAVEQGPDNFNNPAGYRSVADRGLLLGVGGNALDAGPIVGTNNMPYSIRTTPGTLDIVHLGDRRTVANAARDWGTGANNALQPTWLLDNDQTTPQVSTMSAVNATLTPFSRIGVLYQVSDFGGRFDMLLTFTDSSSATLTLLAPDWFNNQAPPGPAAGSGLVVQRQLGVYASTQDTDNANTTTNNLNVAEAVTSVQKLIEDGFGNFAGRRLASITFLNPVSNANYPNSTPATGSGVAILAASMSYPAGGQSCYANCDNSTQAPVLNVADFTCFLQRFAAGDTYANCDNSTQVPTLNVADFTCFLQRFAAGCP